MFNQPQITETALRPTNPHREMVDPITPLPSNRHGLTLIQKDPNIDLVHLETSVLQDDIELNGALQESTAPSHENDPTPKLPNDRKPEDFSIGQSVLFLWAGNLHTATVEKIVPYNENDQHDLKTIFTPLSDENRIKVKKSYEERLEILKSTHEGRATLGQIPDPELLRLKLLLLKGTATLVPDENASPGFLKLVFPDEPGGVLIDMHYNRIIDKVAFKRIKKDPDFYQAWLDSGTQEDKREEHILVEEINNTDWPEKQQAPQLSTGSHFRNLSMIGQVIKRPMLD